MISRTGTLRPYWESSADEMRFGRLDRSITADVVVIGAGVTGVSAAYGLAKSGKRVAVVDAGAVGAGETGRSTAHLTFAIDAGYHGVERLHGTAKARLVLESHEAAIDLIESMVKEERIDCGFERLDGYLFPGPGERARTLEEELHSLRRVGVNEVEMLASAPGPALSPGPCLRYPDQAQVHPLRYLEGLVGGLVRLKGQVFTDTAVQKIGADGVLTRQGFKVRAHDVIVATHSPIKNVLFFLKEAAYRTYVVAFAAPKDSVRAALYWDTGDPASEGRAYHYVRVARGEKEDALIVGGEDHKTGQQDDYQKPFAELERWTRERFPQARQVTHRWSGQVIEPVDSIPFIGRSPYHKERLYIATGYSGNGITYGTVAAMVLRDLVLKKKSEWGNLYSPTRKSVRATMTFLEENMNVFSHFAEDRVRGAEPGPEGLVPGQGAVVQKGIGKVAAYRDESGELHECSAVCPHLGCIVQWNAAERTFDCPCHGSRYTGKGEVITGPATKDLKKISGVRAS